MTYLESLQIIIYFYRYEEVKVLKNNAIEI